MMGSDRHLLRLYIIPCVLLISFSCILLGISPTIYWLDSGELQAALPEIGIPHSPSFPSYMSANHVITYFPLGDMAYRANLATVIVSACLSLLIFTICHLLFRPENMMGLSLCAMASLLFTTNPMIWFQCLKAEVYPLNLLCVTGVIYCLLKILSQPLSEGQLGKISAFIILLLGLGFTNHSLLTAHLVPAAGFVFLLNIKRYKMTDYSLMSLIFILSISIYIYLPIRSSINPGMDTGNPENAMNFINCVTRKGTYNRFFGNMLGEWLINLRIYLNLVSREMGLGIVVGSLIGLLVLLQKNWKIGLFLFIAGFTNIGITCVNKNFNANPDTGPAYLMLSSMIIVICFVWFVFEVMVRRCYRFPGFRILQTLGIVLLFSIPVFWMNGNYQRSSLSRDDSALRVGHAILDVCSQDAAIFFGMYHNLPFVIKYMQIVEKYRTDIIPISRSEMVYWPGGLENLTINYPKLTQNVFSGPFGEQLLYLAPRSCRHSEEIPYEDARALLFNNNVWMAQSYRTHGDVYWFPSEDDHLIRSQISISGPMLHLDQKNKAKRVGFDENSYLRKRIQLDDDSFISQTKGAEVVATYYDLLCITLKNRGFSELANDSLGFANEFNPKSKTICEL